MIRLVGVVAANAVSFRDRRVQVLLEHHIPACLVTIETQLILFSGQDKFMLLVLHGVVTHRTDTGPHRAVHPLLSPHGRMAFLGHTPGISLGKRALTGEEYSKDN